MVNPFFELVMHDVTTSYYAKVDGDAPTTVDEMKFSGTCSASPYVVKYEATKAGKIAYYWLRWVNRKGETGQWSTVVNGMIMG
jgi:hypothetical protein